MKEIVGAMFGTVITNDPQTIREAVRAGTITSWMDRKRMKFMAFADLGIHWERMAKSPTLFCINDTGDIVSP